MPDTDFTNYLQFFTNNNDPAAWGEDGQDAFTFTGKITVSSADGDHDASDTMTIPDDPAPRTASYTGYEYTAPNGLTYAIYQDDAFPDLLYIPFNQSDYDLGANFDNPGSANSQPGDDFAATGNPVCFLTGTRIATPDGSRAVEEIAAGDLVIAADGSTVTVKWVGRQTVSTRFGPAERLMPVRVRSGALGAGMPDRDLVLTADHALLIDGLLINAGALVNGSTIAWVPLAEFGGSYTVYHVETEAHAIILANGTPAETYIDYVARRAFDNYAEYVDLYGEDRVIPEMPVPRVSSARLVPPGIRARLAGEAAA